MRVKRRFLVLCLLAVSASVFAGDVIKAAKSLPKTTPWDLEELSKVPEGVEWLAGKKGGDFYFKGLPYKGKPTRVFANYKTPAMVIEDAPADANLPGIVLVHGGGGRVDSRWTTMWAKRGYAAIALDMGGAGPNRRRLEDGGPSQDDNEKFLTDQPTEDMWTYHSVANIIRLHSLLRSFPEVDKDRTAITGISWGGYLTCIVAGLDNRFKAASPTYGCGFIHENSIWVENRFKPMTEEGRKKWVQLWDPSMYVGSTTVPMFFSNGGKDFAYPPDSWYKTYQLVKTEKNHHFVPFLRHGHLYHLPRALEFYMDSKLKGGTPLAKVMPLKIKKGKVSAKVKSETKLISAELHYSTMGFPGDQKKREYTTLPAKLDGNTVFADLPPEDAEIWFLTVKDERKTVVASEIIITLKEKT